MSEDSRGTLAFQTTMTWRIFLLTMATIPPQKVSRYDRHRLLSETLGRHQTVTAVCTFCKHCCQLNLWEPECETIHDLMTQTCTSGRCLFAWLDHTRVYLFIWTLNIQTEWSGKARICCWANLKAWISNYHSESGRNWRRNGLPSCACELGQ